MGKTGPETRLVKKMRDAGKAEYGSRLVTVKYHGSEYSEAGVSDLLCSLDGVFVACEVKAPESYGGSVDRALSEGPTIKQRAFVARVIATGGIAGFAATVPQFMALLAQVNQIEEKPGPVPHCSACGSSAPHHLASVREHGVCVV